MLPDPTFPTLGFQVVHWMETFLCHGKGDIEGDPWEIDAEFLRFLCWVYRLHPSGHKRAGRRLIHRAILSRPKGRAKSELAGGLVCAEGLGPVRFDHWAAAGEISWWGYEYEAGEPVGRPVRSPFIRCLATEEDQSGNTYDNTYVMLSEGRASREYGLRANREVGLSRVFFPEGGEIRPSSSGNASKDGGLETFAVADETHLYVPLGLRKMYRTVARNTGKRKDGEPWMFDTTTAWAPGEFSVAEQAAEKYAHLSVDECVLKHGVLYDHQQGDEPKRFGDNRSLIKAMRPAYGPAAEWMDFERIVGIIRDAEDPEEEAFRYYLNRPRAGAAHWLGADEVKGILAELQVELGSMIGLGFDGSENDDHTALMACLESGDLFPIGIWTPAGESLDWRKEVMEAVAWTFENFQVVRFYSDPAWWRDELSTWASEYSDPNRPLTLPVAEFWTGGKSEAKMAIATGALRTALRHGSRIDPTPLRTEALERDKKPLLQWHFENARTRKVRVKPDEDSDPEDAYLVRKERKGSSLKIDSVTASVLARAARDHGLALGEFTEPTYTRAAWQGESGPAAPRKVKRSEYLPCRSCAKPIHPDLHSGPENGLCLKCRTRR